MRGLTVPVLVLMGVLAGGAVGSARAATPASCPTRSEIVDSLRGSIGMTDGWLILSFGGVVGVVGGTWGVPAGIASSLVQGAISAAAGLHTIGLVDRSIRESLRDWAGRLHRDPEDIYDQVRYDEDVITGNWLMRVGGAVAGSIAGLLTPLSPLPFQGLSGSVAFGSMGGVALAGIWHRFALWPFSDELPEMCRAAAVPTTRL